MKIIVIITATLLASSALADTCTDANGKRQRCPPDTPYAPRLQPQDLPPRVPLYTYADDLRIFCDLVGPAVVGPPMEVAERAMRNFLLKYRDEFVAFYRSICPRFVDAVREPICGQILATCAGGERFVISSIGTDKTTELIKRCFNPTGKREPLPPRWEDLAYGERKKACYKEKDGRINLSIDKSWSPPGWATRPEWR
jgi:hypothetical protein